MTASNATYRFAASILTTWLATAALACGSTGQQGAAGVGSDGSSTSAAGSGSRSCCDPCSLLSQSEAERVVGQPLGMASETPAIHECDWSTPLGPDFATVSVAVGTWNEAEIGTYANTSPVSGLGDEAWSFPDGGNGVVLLVRKGTIGLHIEVSYTTNSSEDILSREEAVASLVLPRV